MKLTTALLLGASMASAATLSDSLQSGKAALQSAGPLAFGPADRTPVNPHSW